MIELSFTFSEKLWVYHGKGAWFFITVPQEESSQIKFLTSHHRRGWGAVPVNVIIGSTKWKTSIFPDSKVGGYLLPIKLEVRKLEKISAGDSVLVTINLKS
jgi:hypothetical protein